MEITQSAYVLHSRPYRETSALVTFLTPDHGKVNAVVRSARGKSRQASHKQALLQPFQKLIIGWREKSVATSELHSLRHLEAANLRFPLEGERSFCGLYLNELLYRLLYPGVDAGALYDDYEQALYELFKTGSRQEQAWALRRFEVHLLKALGLNLVCDVDARQEAVSEQLDYQFFPEMGAYPLIDAQTTGTGVRISGDCLLKLSRFEYCETCLPAWKRLLRQALGIYLGNKPILARQFFKSS